MMRHFLFRSFMHLVLCGVVFGSMIVSAFFAQPVYAGRFCAAQIANVGDGLASCVSNAASQNESQVDIATSNFSSYLVGTGYECAAAFRCLGNQGDALCAGVAKMAGETVYYACAAQPTDCKKSPIKSTTGLGDVGPCPAIKPHCCAQTDPVAAASENVASNGSSASAAGSPQSLDVPDPLNGATIPSLIGNIVRTFAGIAGSLALAIFVWGGFSMILSGGDAGEVKKAKGMLINASIGIVLIFGAYMLSATIINAILIQNK